MPASTPSPGEPSYTAYLAWGPLGLDVTVTRDIHAGICGPFGTYEVYAGDPADVPALDGLLRRTVAVLARAGYWVTGDWHPYRNGLMCADLVPIGAEVGARLADHLEPARAGS